jgi:hypothetical protein
MTDDDRLDSWKEIAAYLKRDVRTVQRWEKLAGLPVHRVGTAKLGRVYASKAALDAWLATGRTNGLDSPRPPLWRSRRVAVAVALVIATAVVVWRALPLPLAAADLRVQVNADGVVAHDTQGRERWRFAFPASEKAALSVFANPVHVGAGRQPAVFVATAQRHRRADGGAESGQLREFDLGGRYRRTFSFTDQIAIGGKPFGPPWSLDAFAVDERADGTRRIAVAGHHDLWSPSLVTLLDQDWRRIGTFVHLGWIEWVFWLGRERLLVGGFSEEHQGGLVALLDPDALERGPLKMAVMPRSEVNTVTGSRFNRAVVQLSGERIVARTIEVPSDGQEGVDILYEFTPDLALISATPSARYWDTHRALEIAGKITHGRDACPDRADARVVVRSY